MLHKDSEWRVDNDDWRAEKDPRKRKQIQDRLAQRARRKRLAEKKIRECVTEEGNGSARSVVNNTGPHTCCTTPRGATGQQHITISFGIFTQGAPLAMVTTECFKTPCLPMVESGSRSQKDTLPVYAAPVRNGELLGPSAVK
ncbi:hypothetical protein PMZ80_002011 [Knufia obscura]|uniref:Uncharacterized protein n=2 Tax=Knufia TaxID=430999 RepID=A0AAN8EL33_9EURO|nr:hypothetical protein PMZ80_002011 [Knufia obscura]KAK5953828.1 hypothetical protein OHC33_005098 [Knufia fluminis]